MRRAVARTRRLTVTALAGGTIVRARPSNSNLRSGTHWHHAGMSGQGARTRAPAHSACRGRFPRTDLDSRLPLPAPRTRSACRLVEPGPRVAAELRGTRDSPFDIAGAGYLEAAHRAPVRRVGGHQDARPGSRPAPAPWPPTGPGWYVVSASSDGIRPSATGRPPGATPRASGRLSGARGAPSRSWGRRGASGYDRRRA